MALIKCPECGKEVSDTIENCIHCGYKMTKKDTLIDKDDNKDKESKKTLKKEWKNMPKAEKFVCYLMIGFVIFTLLVSLPFVFVSVFDSSSSSNSKSESNSSYYIDTREIARDNINSLVKIKANMYNSKLTYYSHKITDLRKVDGYKYSAEGYVLFNRDGSEKKWETDFTCECKLNDSLTSANCNCNLDDSAHVVY